MNAIADPGPAPEPSVRALGALDGDRLLRMRVAGDEIQECYRVLRKGGLNIVGEVLRGQGTFYEYDHYPEGDVFDGETFCQYYYHSHREDAHEHGHFHTFVRAGAMPDTMRPVACEGAQQWPSGDDALTHLVAVSMDRPGYPLGLFATNRWVTGETWYRADDVIARIDDFRIDHAFPSWPANRWLGAMLQLFHPQVEALLRQRDEVVAHWSQARPDGDVFEDRELEITGYLPVAVDAQIEAVRGELARRELQVTVA